MEHRWTNQFYCDVCGDVCLEIRLSCELSRWGKEAYSMKQTVFSELWLRLQENQYWTLMELFQKKAFGKLYKLNREYVPCYCPTCKKSYCKKHWRSYTAIDEDGYYDAEYGTCPEGHKRMLYD